MASAAGSPRERPRPGLGGIFWEYADPDDVVAGLEAAGFEIEHREEAPGLEGEPRDDARGCRIVARMGGHARP